MTTFWTATPEGVVAGDAVAGAVGPLVGATAVPGPVDEPEITPSLVTTYAHRPSGEVVMAKSPRTGVPFTGRGMGASAVRVPSSTGVTASGHTT